MTKEYRPSRFDIKALDKKELFFEQARLNIVIEYSKAFTFISTAMIGWLVTNIQNFKLLINWDISKWTIFWSLIFLSLNILLVLLTMLFSNEAIKYTIHANRSYYLNGGEYNDSSYNKAIRFCNLMGLISFFTGIVFLILFYVININ